MVSFKEGDIVKVVHKPEKYPYNITVTTHQGSTVITMNGRSIKENNNRLGELENLYEDRASLYFDDEFSIYNFDNDELVLATTREEFLYRVFGSEVLRER